jgi:four helix bundle protein
VSDYERLDVWRAAHALALAIYQATSTFPADERFGLAAQMRRAAASIPMNLAEGSGRSTDRDHARFVANAIGSASQLEYQLRLAADLG